jgi:hypothetical protein
MPNAVPWWASSLLSAALALGVAWVAIAFDRRKTVNQELIRKRIAIYEQMAPLLNDLFCFFRSVGAWKALTPPDMIAHKRTLDRLFHLYEPLFSRQFTRRYDQFIAAAFATFLDIGADAKLRASRLLIHQEWGDKWQEAWSDNFVDAADEQTSHYEFGRAYYALMDQFAVEIGVRRRRWLGGRLHAVQIWPFTSG